jgi:hypothetical protein
MTGGTLSFFEAGTITPLEVFADADGNTSLGTVVDIGDLGYPITSGNAITAIFPPLGGYKVVLADANAVVVWTADDQENVAETFLGTQANIQSGGSKSVTSGYTIVPSDYLVTVNEPTTNPAIINLPTATSRGAVLIVKNMSATITVALTPNGSDTIDSASGALTLGTNVSGQNFPSGVTLLSDGVSNWWIQSDKWGTP